MLRLYVCHYRILIVVSHEISVLVELQFQVAVQLYIVAGVLFADLDNRIIREFGFHIFGDGSGDEGSGHRAGMAIDILPIAGGREIDFGAVCEVNFVFTVILLAGEELHAAEMLGDELLRLLGKLRKRNGSVRDCIDINSRHTQQ